MNSPVNQKRQAYVEFRYDDVVLESKRFHCLNVGGGGDNTAQGIAAVGGGGRVHKYYRVVAGVGEVLCMEDYHW